MIIFKIRIKIMKKFVYSQLRNTKGFNFNKLNYGIIFLKSISSGYISKKNKEDIIYIMKRNIKNFKLNLTFNKVQTKKSLDTRMGGGKGSIFKEIYFVKFGSILIEMYDISLDKALYLSKILNNKIPIKLKLAKIQL